MLSQALYQDNRTQAFYTDADEIRYLMMELLGDVSGKDILEPCAGHGAFIKDLIGKPHSVDAIDVDGNSIQVLQRTFGNNVFVKHGDFIDYFISGAFSSPISLKNKYDAIICNPPYGLRFSKEYRALIKSQYPDLYARESYGLFMYFGVSCLEEKGRYVFIVPDTFLTSRNHRPLREFLIKQARPTEIVQIASSRFETVNFGYGSLCIIAGQKEPLNKNHEIFWYDARAVASPLNLEATQKSEIILGDYLINQFSDGWTHPKTFSQLPSGKNFVSLGEIAECRTGFYSGDNEKFCGYCTKNPPRRLNGHGIEWDEIVYQGALTDAEKINGIKGEKYYVPFVRGGHRQPFEKTFSAVNWSLEAIAYYKSDSKSRFQNAGFYFRRGLAIPMVTSGRISASLMEDSVFDQGVVGVFPHEDNLTDFLLIYLNSTYVSKLKKAINPGANNSANYIKRIPVPVLDELLKLEATKIVEQARLEGWESSLSKREDFVGRIIAEALPI